MNTNVHKTTGQISVACFALLTFALQNHTHAQFTGNNQTNIISGVTNNWPGDLYVGSNYVFDALLIQDSGVLNNSGNSYIGHRSGGKSNAVVVGGSGSAWNGGANSEVYVGNIGGAWNSLTITNGGIVSCSLGVIGGAKDPGPPSGSNVVVVTGPGSAWINSSELSVGDYGVSNILVINNGGAVSTAVGYIGHFSGSSNNFVLVTGIGSVLSNSFTSTVGYGAGNNSLVINDGGKVIATGPGSIIGLNAGSNRVLVTGNGSVWNNYHELDVGGSGSDNALTISNGGSVVATSIYIGSAPGSIGNRIDISNGTLIATNVLDVRRGTLSLSGGAVTADSLLLTNGSSSVIAFNAGTLNTPSTTVSKTQQFVVGDGTNVANFHAAGAPHPFSGVHSFSNGLRIRTNSFLTGCGTINGSLLVDAGGTVLADCGGNLTFTGNLTNNGVMMADNGSVLESSGTLVNNGKILLFNGGTINFHGTFINNGSVLNSGTVAISGVSRAGNDVRIQIPSATGFTYHLQFTPSLQPPAWTDTGPAQSGTSGVLTFTDPGAATNVSPRFYRVRVQ